MKTDPPPKLNKKWESAWFKKTFLNLEKKKKILKMILMNVVHCILAWIKASELTDIPGVNTP